MGICSRVNTKIGTILYETEWLFQSDLQGNSQTVALMNESTRVVDFKTFNKSSNRQSHLFKNLPEGPYLLEATLFSGTDGNGNKVGSILTSIRLGSSFNTVVGPNPTSLQTQTARSEILAGESNQVFALGKFDRNRATFLSSEQLVFQRESNIDSISQNQFAFSGSPGKAEFQVSYPPKGLSAKGSYHVNASSLKTNEWTVYVYLNGASDLFQFSNTNIEQMLRSVTNSSLRFVIQWKQSQQEFPASSFDGTRRYLLEAGPNGKPQIKLIQDLEGTIDMGRASTLNQFLQFAVAHYPSRRSVFVAWSHGNGWLRDSNRINPTRSFTLDNQTGHQIQTWEIAQAFQGFHFDIFAWDASLMQMAEVAYELIPFASFVTGSEESPPGEGLPYDRVFTPFARNPGASTASLSRSFVDAMLSFPAFRDRLITQSVLDTSQLHHLASALQQLVPTLIANAPGLSNAIEDARVNVQNYSSSPTRRYYDLIGLMQRLMSHPEVPQAIKSQAQNVIHAAQLSIVYEGHNNNSPGSNGISIQFSDAGTFNQVDTTTGASQRTDYQMLQFSTASQWDNWLTVSP